MKQQSAINTADHATTMLIEAFHVAIVATNKNRKRRETEMLRDESTGEDAAEIAD